MRFSALALCAIALVATILGSILGSSGAAAHGWHRICRHGLTDVHKHVKGVGRVECTTQRCYMTKWGYKRCRWS